MNRLLLCFIFITSSHLVFSQKIYFIYLQTEPEQPFFIKINDKIHSSSKSGYLILSKLKDTTCSFSLGFPGNKWPEQNFSIAINKKDHGYLIKNFGEKGWGLLNLQSLSVEMPVSGVAKTETPLKTENKDVSDFTNVLSKAADDPSLKEKPVQSKEALEKNEAVIQKPAEKDSNQPAPVKTVPIADTLLNKKELLDEKPAVETSKENTGEKKNDKDEAELKKEIKAIEKVDTPAVQDNNISIGSYKKSIVKRRSESSTTEGFGLVFTDEIDGFTDTIRIFIPNIRQAATEKEDQENKGQDKKFLNLTETPDSMKVKEDVKPDIEEKGNVAVVRNKCQAVADQGDFFRVRKRMAAEANDDNMINEARKYFKTKCFTVVQLKNLSSLFLDDDGKYKFFDMAYPYVSDIENFQSLQAELKDAYYINRFRAMLRL